MNHVSHTKQPSQLCLVLYLVFIFNIANYLIIKLNLYKETYFVNPGIAPTPQALLLFKLFIILLLPVLGKPTKKKQYPNTNGLCKVNQLNCFFNIVNHNGTFKCN